MATEGRAGPVRWAFSDATDGDFRVDPHHGPDARLRERRRALTGPIIEDSAWTALRQVHGSTVVVVDRPGDHDGAEADASVTTSPGAVLSVTTADCAPVLLYGNDGAAPVVGAVHAGWRGLYDGVLEHTVAAMRSLGATSLTAWLGPCISPAAYEFGDADLMTLALRFGPDVVGATTSRTPAFDLRAGVRVALGDVGVELAQSADDIVCTATGGAHHSWRAQRTELRQVSVIWIEP